MRRGWLYGVGAFLLATALGALSGCGSHKDTAVAKRDYDALVQQLKDPDKALRAKAAETIRLKGMSKDAIPQLIAAFEDEDRLVRRHAAEALTPVCDVAYPTLLEKAKSEKPNVRAMAIYAMGNLAHDAPEELRKQGLVIFIPALKDPEDEVRVQAAYAINRSNYHAVPYMKEILAALQESKSKMVRGWLVNGLGNIGEPAKEALPLLEELKKDPDPEISKGSMIAWHQISGVPMPEEEPQAPRGGPRRPGGGGGNQTTERPKPPAKTGE